MPPTTTIPLRLPTGSDEEMAFQTFRNYLEATRNWATDQYPHADGLLAGVADAVKARPWRSDPPGRKRLSSRAGKMLRNAWATEVLLNAPRSLGGDLVTFANLWTPVQAYYAVFNGMSALTHVVTGSPPHGHAKLLSWAATAAASPRQPFVPPWTARVGGAPGAWTYHDLGSDPIDERISNLASPRVENAPSLLAMGLRTTRGDQIDARRPEWIKKLPPTARGKVRVNLPRADLLREASKLRPTTLFDLLYRLRIRSNYEEADAFIAGPLSARDAADFHDALCDIVAATLLTIEIYTAHHVGASALETCAKAVPIPSTLRAGSVIERRHLWS